MVYASMQGEIRYGIINIKNIINLNNRIKKNGRISKYA